MRIKPIESQICSTSFRNSSRVIGQTIPRGKHYTHMGIHAADCNRVCPKGSKGHVKVCFVEDRTGYPKNMLDLKLEADLGIDSIKRVEIIGALLRVLPSYYRKSQDNEKLGTLHKQPTLCGMLDMLGEIKAEGKTTLPLDQTKMDSNILTSIKASEEGKSLFFTNSQKA